MVKSGDEGGGIRSQISRSGIFAGIAVVLVALVCVRLGFWQLDRLAQRRAANQTIAAGLAAPPLSLNADLVSEIARDPGAFAFHRVVAQGEFEDGGEFLLRGRSEAGRPGVHLIAPLVLPDGTKLLVNRGWLPSPDAATVDPRPHRRPGTVQIEGVIQPLLDTELEPQAGTIRLPDTTVSSYQRIDRIALQPLLGPLPPFYLQLTNSGAEQLPVPPTLPALDNGPHLGYAVQWFSFAVIAVVGFLIAARKARHNSDPAG